MPETLFIATQRFDPRDGDRWRDYCAWAKIPGLQEVVSLDSLLCPRLVTKFTRNDWKHIVNADFRLDYFRDFDYLLERIRGVPRRNVLGLYRNPERHLSKSPAPGDFTSMGYDLIEEATQISALTNCGGFPDVFTTEELNHVGLLTEFARAHKVRQELSERHPQEPHAQCELYAIWGLNEAEQGRGGGA